MSLRTIFNKIFFKKHKPGKVVAQSGDKVFRKLTSEEYVAPTPPDVPIPPIEVATNTFNLGLIPLKPGTYTIVSTARATHLRLAESDFSDSVEYTVE